MRQFMTALALAALAARAAAADHAEAPDIFAKLNPKVGAWAEYAYVDKKGDSVERKGTFRISVVGKEGDGYWVEEKIEMELPKPKKDHGPALFKMLVTKDGPQKMYMKTGTTVMDMSSMSGSSARKKHAQMDKTKITEAGEESVSVTAGKYKATRYAYVNEKNKGDYWLKKGVGPYGLVKQAGTEGKGRTSSLDLLSSGSGAKTEIDESTAQSMFSAGMRGGAARPAAGDDSGSSAGSSASSMLGNAFGDALKRKVRGSH